ncbi:arylamine N-acetyltransferase 2 [Podospora appendiculata]|uniref:Arylamine N-acetyltransferase 2 n=1 Tax=Podospora appendiculata TaxID=314037 RepID=A0AAE0WZR6_9PEZI|nr:arylamine N-acetyltransferase 2 [Podospora appendiculata]
MSSEPNPDSAYSPAQVAEYLAHLGLPPSFHPSANPVLDLTYLTSLFVHHITTIPYENLTIHYSPEHAISLDPQVLFDKIVTNGPHRGRGGYCMEVAILFNHMLRALGFADAYTAGVRVRPRVNAIPQGDFAGWVHLVNIVTLPPSSPGSRAQKFALDVGFGGDGPTMPLPLVDGLVHHNSIGTQEIRLVYDFIPGQRFRGDGAHKSWIYQYRNGVDKEWNPFYAFPDVEFRELDFGMLNYYVSQAPESFQTFTPLVTKFLRSESAEGPKVTGKIMLVNGDVKRNVTGKTELVKSCASESERVEALREHFGIVLTPEEAASIKGRVVELGATVA